MNCPNCNAPIVDGICEYCGTQIETDIQYIVPIYMGGQQIDQVVYSMKSKKIVRGDEV